MLTFCVLFPFVLFVTISGNNCPKPETINPCTCETNRDESEIKCYYIDYDIDLKTIFKNISQELVGKDKHFSSFRVLETRITEIPDNVFADITFDIIKIESTTELTRIHTNAFNGTQHTVTDISIKYAPILVSTGPDYDLFRALNSLHKLNLHEIGKAKHITEIPDQAFDGLTNLTRIWIHEGRLKTIGQNIIRNLKNISLVDFTNNQIDTIADNAFTTDVMHTDVVEIYLPINKLNVDQMNVFRNINYPISLDIQFNNITYLDESIFGPILRNYDKSIIMNSNMDCNDCRNVWLIRDEKLRRELKPYVLQCSDGYIFDDELHFHGC